jgi:hypothetical protein
MVPLIMKLFAYSLTYGISRFLGSGNNPVLPLVVDGFEHRGIFGTALS